MKFSQADAPPPFQPGKPIGNVYYGACSWTDRTLIDAGTLYPGNARTAADRLAHYSSQFPIVEVDATYYALPSERNARLWMERTPHSFIFNIKAFGLFTHHPVPSSGSRPRSGSCCQPPSPAKPGSTCATCRKRSRS